jgi:ubiquinone/menaquinone biosynthesis C-methylase UbiE
MKIDPEWGGAAYSVRRYYVDRFFARVLDGVAPGSRVLDLGALRTQKRGQFNLDLFDVWAICVNMTRERRPHVQADAHDLPFADGAFDVVVCGEVLEHVKSPIGVLAEARRVLRPGGRLVATVPFLYRIHADPHDYGRYTQHYWHQTLAELGWSGVQIE